MGTPERHGFQSRPRMANLRLYQQPAIAKTAKPKIKLLRIASPFSAKELDPVLY